MTGTVAATVAVRARRRIEAHFTSAGATLPTHAIAPPALSVRVERRILRRMIAFGALRAAAVTGEAGEGRYWLDAKRAADFRKESLARVLTAVAVAGFAAAGAIAFGG